MLTRKRLAGARQLGQGVRSPLSVGAWQWSSHEIQHCWATRDLGGSQQGGATRRFQSCCTREQTFVPPRNQSRAVAFLCARIKREGTNEG
jgi:hypothetical protein